MHVVEFVQSRGVFVVLPFVVVNIIFHHDCACGLSHSSHFGFSFLSFFLMIFMFCFFHFFYDVCVLALDLKLQ